MSKKTKKNLYILDAFGSHLFMANIYASNLNEKKIIEFHISTSEYDRQTLNNNK